jgi:hypothetical protein
MCGAKCIATSERMPCYKTPSWHPLVDENKWVVDTGARHVCQAGEEKVIQYSSKGLLPAQQMYCKTKWELLGATWALKTFRLFKDRSVYSKLTMPVYIGGRL